MINPSVVINYCSNESMFLEPLLKQCLKFSNDIVVSYGSHLYDGTPENIAQIVEVQTKYPTVKFVMYNVDLTLDLYKQRGVSQRPTAYWHNLARWTGIQSIQNKEWVFIIDCDEIPEGDKLERFLSATIFDENICYRFSNYWYFKSLMNQATSYEDSVVFIHYKYLNESTVFGDWERGHTTNSVGIPVQNRVLNYDNTPLFHHYSWVRTRAGLKHKIQSWAHSNDRFKGVNADELIEGIYKDDNVNDCVHNYTYKSVENIFDIIL